MLEDSLLEIPVNAKHFSVENCRNTIKAEVGLKKAGGSFVVDHIKLSISNPRLNHGIIGVSYYKEGVSNVEYMKHRSLSFNPFPLPPNIFNITNKTSSKNP